MPQKLELYVAAGIIALAVFIYCIATAKKRKRLKLLGKVRTAYGRVPKREYSEAELLKIRTYFDTVKDPEGYYVDDITWNDLDMDSVFIAMNHTFSSVGEDVLYDLLREPSFSGEELEERERLIRFFCENDRVREELMMDYASVGRTRKFSLVQFLNQFRDLTLKDNMSYYGHVFAIFIGIGLIFVEPALGILALIGIMIYNIYTYYRDKTQIEPYYVSLSAMSYLVRASLRIGTHNEPELSAYTSELRRETEPVRSLIRNMKWIGGGVTVGGSMDIMQILMDYFRMVTHLDFVFFNKMVRSVLHNEEHLMKIMKIMGYLEAMISIGSYRETLPFYCKGELSDSRETNLHIKDGYHPLLSEPVANSVTVERPVLITGSNASGKSTFLRVTALSALMAQTVNTVYAHEYSGSFYRIYSSMALRDNVQAGESYYIAEIRSLKRIMDAAGEKEKAPVLAFVDEVLRGTNTVERIAASSQILKSFAEDGVMLFTATHDIELTRILEAYYDNYHFQEEVKDGQVLFDYVLRTGRATTRNAIRLLEVMGYDEAVTEKAEASAERFVREGTWEVL